MRNDLLEVPPRGARERGVVRVCLGRPVHGRTGDLLRGRRAAFAHLHTDGRPDGHGWAHRR